MIIEKRQAHVWSSTVPESSRRCPGMLGVARGDDTRSGVGDKKLSEIKTEERTTPAGRFVAEIGTNARGEDVVWVDYDAAVSMHRVLTTNAKEQRARRLETPTPKDNRVSYGCINVPEDFFEYMLNTTVRTGNSVVYVLPETRPLRSVFSKLASAQSNLTTERKKKTGHKPVFILLEVRLTAIGASRTALLDVPIVSLVPIDEPLLVPVPILPLPLAPGYHCRLCHTTHSVVPLRSSTPLMPDLRYRCLIRLCLCHLFDTGCPRRAVELLPLVQLNPWHPCPRTSGARLRALVPVAAGRLVPDVVAPVPEVDELPVMPD